MQRLVDVQNAVCNIVTNNHQIDARSDIPTRQPGQNAKCRPSSVAAYINTSDCHVRNLIRGEWTWTTNWNQSKRRLRRDIPPGEGELDPKWSNRTQDCFSFIGLWEHTLELGIISQKETEKRRKSRGSSAHPCTYVYMGLL